MILITGAKGFVGHKLMELCKDTIASPSLRNATQEMVNRMIGESNADVIIHTAAISDIGTCQANPEASYFANVQIPIYLANACKENNKKLICFSSDQVYSACEDDGPYTEETVKPGNIYAMHKLEMEKRVLDILPSSVMLRAEWMYDYYEKRSNYLMIILNAINAINALDAVHAVHEDDTVHATYATHEIHAQNANRVAFSSKQFRGITYLKEVAENMDKVISLPGGAYNFGSETTQSMYEITNQFLAMLGKMLLVEDAPARHNLWMDCSKARKYGVEFSSVIEGLARCAKDYRLLKDR